MKRIPFNDGWFCKKQGDSHEYNLSYEKVSLPHDAVIGEKRDKNLFNGTKKAFFANGAWEYVKVFLTDENLRGKRIFVEFQGVYSHAHVYLNGNYVGERAYGYSEFTIELTKYLNYDGNNLLKVICKTNDDSRWYTGAGIYRNVNLLEAGDNYIKNNGIKIKTLKATESNAELQVSIDAEITRAAKANIEIRRNGEKIAEKQISVEENGSATLFVKNPLLWSDETPDLYSCKVTLESDGVVVDETEEKFGIRTLSVSASRGLKVNGKTVKLRGACIHHDNGVIGVRTFKEAEYRRVKILKESGFNAIRSAHHPMSRELLDACDELGVYVMDEAFDVWQIPKSADDYANDFNDNYRKDLLAMIDKDYNRPSVIMYSIGNEISDLATRTGVEKAKELLAIVKNYDDTRFTTIAINGLLLLMNKQETAKLLSGDFAEEKRDINETMSSLDEVMEKINNAPSMDKTIEGGANAVDIAGYNYMHNRYAADKEKYPERVIVGSETYTKYVYEMWNYIKDNANVIGDFCWTGWDYLGETGIGNVSYENRDYHDGFYGDYPCITAGCGDIDITGYRLPQSYYREIVFGLRKKPYIAVHNPKYAGETEYLSAWGWADVISSWNFDCEEGKILTVDVYGYDEAELFLNGQSVGKRTLQRNMCSFSVPYRKGELKAILKGDESLSFSLQSGNGEVMPTIKPERYGETLLFVNVELQDENGEIAIDKDRSVTIDIEGGDLIGFGNGNTKTEESFISNVHSTYHGRAFAVIKRKSDKTKIIVTDGERKTEKIC